MDYAVWNLYFIKLYTGATYHCVSYMTNFQICAESLFLEVRRIVLVEKSHTTVLNHFKNDSTTMVLTGFSTLRSYLHYQGFCNNFQFLSYFAIP